jgi:hypothetical protein
MPPKRSAKSRDTYNWILKALYDVENCEPKALRLQDLSKVIDDIHRHLPDASAQAIGTRVMALAELVQTHLQRHLTRMERNDDEREEMLAERRRINRALKSIDAKSGSAKKPRQSKKRPETFDLVISKPDTPVLSKNTSLSDSFLMPEPLPPLVAFERDDSSNLLFGDEAIATSSKEPFESTRAASSITFSKETFHEDANLQDDNDYPPPLTEHNFAPPTEDSLAPQIELVPVEQDTRLSTMDLSRDARGDLTDLDKKLTQMDEAIYASLRDRTDSILLPINDSQIQVDEIVRRVEQMALKLPNQTLPIADHESGDEDLKESTPAAPAHPRVRRKEPQGQRTAKTDKYLMAKFYRDTSPNRRERVTKQYMRGWDLCALEPVEINLPSLPTSKIFLTFYTRNCELSDYVVVGEGQDEPVDNPVEMEEEGVDPPALIEQFKPTSADLSDIPNLVDMSDIPVSFGGPADEFVPPAFPKEALDFPFDAADDQTGPIVDKIVAAESTRAVSLPDPVFGEFSKLSEIESIRRQQSGSVGGVTITGSMIDDAPPIIDAIETNKENKVIDSNVPNNTSDVTESDSDSECNTQQRLIRLQQFKADVINCVQEDGTCTFRQLTTGCSRIDAYTCLDDMVYLFKCEEIHCVQSSYLGEIIISIGPKF